MAQYPNGNIFQICKRKTLCKTEGLLLLSFSRHEGKSGLIRNNIQVLNKYKGNREYHMYSDTIMIKIIALHTRSPLRAYVTPCRGQRLSLLARPAVRILIFRSALCASLRINHKSYASAYKNIRRGESRKP